MGQWGEVHSRSYMVDESQCAIKISTGLGPRLLPRKKGRLSQIKKKKGILCGQTSVLIEMVGIGILFVPYQFNFALLRSTDPNSLLKKFNATVRT